jgi:hypothetical protein
MEEYEELDDDDYVKITGISMLKMAMVVAVTTLSVAFYAISFVDLFIVETSMASLGVLGAAGGITLLLAPWVCVKEWGLARYPSKFMTCIEHCFIHLNMILLKYLTISGIKNSINGLRKEAKALEKEIQTLRVEVVELKAEADRLDQHLHGHP